MADALVLGGGIDGLAAAATLAKGGLRVTLLDARETLGGLAASEELAPEFATAGDRLTWAPPIGLLDDLDLERHGLRFRTEAPPLLVTDGTEPGLFVHESAGPMWEELSSSEAQVYADWRARIQRWTPPLRAALLTRPPDASSRSIGDIMALGRTALGVRRLGERDLFELMRVAPTAAQDWLEDCFEDLRLRAGLAVTCLAGTSFGPRAPGTAATLLLDAILRGPEPLGGPTALVNALAAAARAHGAELRTDARVANIRVEDGRVRGVVMADGATLDSELVLSTLDFTTTALDLIEPARIPARLEAAARAWKSRGRTAVVHFALDTAPEFPASDGRPVERASTATTLRTMERAADAAKHQRMADEPWMELRVMPCDSGAVVTVHVAGVPEGHGDRDGIEAAARTKLESIAPGSGAHIIGARAKTPLDLADEHGLTGGHLYHGELSLDQLWLQKPSLACSRYALPIDGLYLGGGSAHPGGGLPGGGGVLAARAALG